MKKLLFIIITFCMCQTVCAQEELLSLADSCAEIGDFEKAQTYANKALALCKQNYGEESSEYAEVLMWKSMYSGMNRLTEATDEAKQASRIFAKTKGKKSEEYSLSIHVLASYYHLLGNYQEAIRLGSEVVEIQKELRGTNDPFYAWALNNLVTYYNDIGNYQKAIRINTEVLRIRKSIFGEKHEDYAISLNNHASCYYYLGNYQEAVKLETEVMNIFKEIYGGNHPYYATSLNNLALYYSNLGNYQEAVRLETMAMEIRKEVLGEKHPDFAQSLDNLAGYYCDLGNYPEAIRLGTEAMETRKGILGEKHPDYATSLNNLAGYKAHTGNYHEAICLGTEALTILREVLGENHPDYATALNSLAGYYGDYGNYPEAIRLAQEALTIRREINGTKHPNYAISLDNLSNYYHYIGNKQEYNKYAREAFNLGKELIVGNFATMTPFEMNNFLKSKNHFISERPSVTVAYDALLLSKGILLNAEMGINELIQESGDKAAIEMFEHIRMNTLVLNKQLEKPIAERYLNTDSLSAEIEKERKQLAIQSKAFGDFTRFFNTSWQDVRDNLKANEAAIEFGTLKEGEIIPSSHCTRALIIKHDSQEPIDIYLELDSTKNFQTNILANWPTIQQHMQGITKVYFSPSAELYSTPIENYISDGREYIRVSSTREVVMSNSTGNSADKPMKLYGGLKYDMTIDALTGANKEYKIEESEQQDLYAYAKRSSRDAITQVVFDELKGTLKEVQAIEEIAKSNKRKCEVLTGEQGTEESLRAINGKRYGILHFSTHGFYWTEEEAEDRALDNRLSFLRMGDDQPRRYEEDKSMTRSGLIFSGANLAMGGAELPEGMEDGIATAQEISHLDLRGCGLVVLSACQTGLGEVSGEGVFGLQRGFKKAGVNSILMSLWEVDDRATQMLMVEFYKHYLAGDSKLESLHKAQQYVKSQPGFESPEYWAAFILLDGMN